MLGGIGTFPHRAEVHSRQSADKIQVAYLLCSNVHEEVLSCHVYTVEPLEYCVAAETQLHGRTGKKHVRDADQVIQLNRIDEFLDVLIHGPSIRKEMLVAGCSSTSLAIEMPSCRVTTIVGPTCKVFWRTTTRLSLPYEQAPCECSKTRKILVTHHLKLAERFAFLGPLGPV